MTEGGEIYNLNNPNSKIDTQIAKYVDERNYHYYFNYSPASSGEPVSVPYFYPHDLGSTTFMGREDKLDELHQLLQTSQRVGIVAATGMGGIGKTELAWQYADRHQGDYPGGIWWLSAATLVGNVLTYGTRMKLPEAPDTLATDKDRVQWYYDRWIEALPDGKRLLVWDDVSNYALVKAFLPQNERYRVLLTTRSKLGSPVQPLELGALKPKEALELLRRLVGESDRIDGELESAQALCQWLGNLPLGIELVGRHLAGRPTLKLATLLERLKDQRFKAKAMQQIPAEMHYQYNLEAAFELSWQLLDEEAQQVGCLLSVFALAPIKREWVVASLAEWDEEALEEAEAALLRWSLVSLEEGQYLLHSLIREFFTQKLKTEMATEAEGLQRGMAEAMVAEAETVSQTVTLAELARVQGAVPHWQVIAEDLTDFIEGIDVLLPFVALGRVAQGQNRWQEAEQWLQDCLVMSEGRFGSEHPYTAMALNNLAASYQVMEQYDELMLPLHERALEIFEQELGGNHPYTAMALSNLAVFYSSIEQHDESVLPLLERALKIFEQTLGENNPHTVTTLSNLAAFYSSIEQYESALPLYKRALEISERTLGKNHPDTATAMNSLAAFYSSREQYESALPLYKRSLEIYEQELGENHLFTARGLNNLAGLYKSMRDFESALPLFERALGIYEQELGENHPHTARVLNNLAGLYQSMRDYKSALPLCERALAIYEQALGENHPRTARALNNLAFLYFLMRDYESALPLYEKALDIFERTLRENHPHTATTVSNLAGLYVLMRDYKSALPLFDRALEISERTLGENHPHTAKVLNHLVLMYFLIGPHESALPVLEKVLEIRERKLGENHPDMATTLNYLVVLYSSIGCYESVLPLFERALGIYERELGGNHPHIAKGLNNLAGLYESMERYSDAERLHIKSFAILAEVLGEKHPDTQIVIGNFRIFLRESLEAGREGELSQHPMTQKVLSELRGQ